MAESSVLSEPTIADGALVATGVAPDAAAGVAAGVADRVASSVLSGTTGQDGAMVADGSVGGSVEQSAEEQIEEPVEQVEERVDGRRARRERNREAVVDAVLELLREGNLRPSTDQIAERAGLSPRSLFRYFDDVDDLFGVAIRKQARFFREHLRVEIDPTLPLAERVAALVEQRLDLYDVISGVGVVARSHEPFRPQVRAELAQFRALVRDQLRSVVADDLAGVAAEAAEVAERRLAAAEMLLSFESYRMLLDDRSLDRAGAAGVMAEGLATLLTAR